MRESTRITGWLRFAAAPVAVMTTTALAHAQAAAPAAPGKRPANTIQPAATSTAAGPLTAPSANPTPAPPIVETSEPPVSDAPGAQKVTFDEAVRRAIDHNPTSEIAVEEIKRSEALVEQVRSTWLPTLSANGTYTRLDGDRVLGDRVLANANQLSANLTLNVPIINARAWAATARAKENIDYSKLSAIDAKRTIAVSAGRAYLTVIAQRRVLESSIHARDQARAHEEYAKTRFEGGVGNRLDFVRAAQERAASETRVQSQTFQLTRAQEALGVLLGEQAPIDAVDVSLPAPPSLATAMSEAETTRADVIAQRNRVEISRKAVRDNYTDYLPVLSANAQPFYQNPATPTLPETGWQAQLILTIPLYDGGNRYGLAHEREALHDQQKTRLDAALRQARSDVRTSFESVRRADAALVQAREAAKLAEESLDLAQTAYRAGATTNIEVIDAERRALDATTDAAIAEDAARQARLDLLAASGRFPADLATK